MDSTANTTQLTGERVFICKFDQVCDIDVIYQQILFEKEAICSTLLQIAIWI